MLDAASLVCCGCACVSYMVSRSVNGMNGSVHVLVRDSDKNQQAEVDAHESDATF